MYTIKIKGEAKASLEDKDGNYHALSLEQLLQCNYIDIQDDFVEYIDEDYKYKLDSGYTHFKLDEGKLYSICVYEANEKLTDEELELLGDYTQGQWSDGIGEGFEQYPCKEIDDMELYISPWFSGQVCEVLQYEIPN